MAAMTSLLNTLMDTAVEHLTDRLLTDVSDDTKAGLVRAGKLQEDPTVRRIILLMRPGGQAYPHVLSTLNNGLQTPAYLIGGGAYWRRRFILEVECYFAGEVFRDVARTNAQVVLSRAHAALTSLPLPSSVDSFGEHAIQLQVEKAFMQEGGGPGNFIHKGEIWFEVLTERAL